ncbi:MAG: toprim domain-containing protein [Porticoccaceae bacterium]
MTNAVLHCRKYSEMSMQMIDLGDAPEQQEERNARQQQEPDSRAAFRGYMARYGLHPGEIEATGKIIRFDIDRKGDKAGWYVLHADETPAGSFGNWKSDLTEIWCSRDTRTMSPDELAAHNERNRQMQAQREAAKKELQAEAAIRAQRILEDCTSDPAQHPYAIQKRVPFGEFVTCGPWRKKGWSDALLVPLTNISGDLTTISAINVDGKKDLLYGGLKQGSFYALGTPAPGGTVYIAEGVATGASIHESTGGPVACAIDAGNMFYVAKAIREKFPNITIVICADDDQAPDTSKNTGLEAAHKAAKEVNGLVAEPGLGRKADWWDLWNEQGADAVRAALDGAMAVVKSTIPSKRELEITLKEWTTARLSPDCIVKDYMYADLLTTVAPGGTGKTTSYFRFDLFA